MCRIATPMNDSLSREAEPPPAPWPFVRGRPSDAQSLSRERLSRAYRTLEDGRSRDVRSQTRLVPAIALKPAHGSGTGCQRLRGGVGGARGLARLHVALSFCFGSLPSALLQRVELRPEMRKLLFRESLAAHEDVPRGVSCPN